MGLSFRGLTQARSVPSGASGGPSACAHADAQDGHFCIDPAVSAQLKPQQKVFRYLLRKLVINRSNQVWALDTTYIRMKKGFVYLMAVVDVYSRRILAHWTTITLEAMHEVEALAEAFARFGRPDIVNTDQGSQFTAQEFVACSVPCGQALHGPSHLSIDVWFSDKPSRFCIALSNHPR